MLNFGNFIQVYVFTANHHLKRPEKKDVTTCDEPTWPCLAAWSGCGTAGSGGMQVWNG